MSLMNRKYLIAGFSMLIFLFAACDEKSRNADRSQTMMDVKRDALSDSVFADELSKMEFRNDGTVFVYSHDVAVDPDGDSWVKDFEGTYSAFPEKNLLKLNATKLCFQNQTMSSFESYVQKNLDATVANITEMLLNGSMDMDSASQKYFMEINRQSIESMGKAALDDTVNYLYYLSEDENQLTLVQKKSDNPGSEDIVFSEDDSGEYEIDVYGSEIIIYPLTKLNSDGEREEVGEESTSYTAFVEWMDGHRKFSGAVYKNFVIENGDKTYMKISKPGRVSGTFSFSSSYTDAGESISGSSYILKSEIAFDETPEELSNLKSASMSQEMVSMPFVFERE